jgi:SnoaL-like domain
VPAILELLAEDARFTMPPPPAWFLGREDVGRFFTERMFASPWRLVPIRANGQLAFACYQGDPESGRFRLGAVNVLSLRAGRIVEIAGFPRPCGAPPLRTARGAAGQRGSPPRAMSFGSGRLWTREGAEGAPQGGETRNS